MTINEDILNASIRHMVWLERYKASEVKKIIALLNKMDADLIEQIAARMTKIEQRGYDLGKDTTKRLNDMLLAIRQQRSEAMAALYEATSEDLLQLVTYEADFQGKVIQSSAAVYGAEISMVQPAVSQLHAAVTKQPFQGRLLRDWYSDQEANYHL